MEFRPVRQEGRDAPNRKPVKVLVIRDHLIWSGGTIQFLDLLPRLDPSRIVATFCVLGDYPEQAVRFGARGIAPVLLRRRWHDPYGLGRLCRLIRVRQPDLLHLSGPRSMLVGRLAGWLTGRQSVILFNNQIRDPAWQVWLQRRLVSATAAGIAVSKYTADWAARTYALTRDMIEVRHSGTDMSAFFGADPAQRSRIRARLGVPADARVILLAGRIRDDHKGQFGTIRMLPEVLRKIPTAHLLIAGDGPDLPACRLLVDDLGLQHAVTFAGLRRDMPDILTASDVAILPSRYEDAFPCSALEASACGKPVIVSRSGGLPEAVRDGETGFVVAKEDWRGLAEAIVRCLSDPDLARRLGENGRAFVRSFSIDDYAAWYTTFHEDLARRSGRAFRSDRGSP